MTRIRVDPPLLIQVAQRIQAVAASVRRAGDQASIATASAPDYEGQFGAPVAAMGSELQSQAAALAGALDDLSQQLLAKAQAFALADQASLSAIEDVVRYLGPILAALRTLETYGLAQAFPWLPIERLLRLGGLVDGDGGGAPPPPQPPPQPPWWAPIAIGLGGVWNWYDQNVNRRIYEAVDVWGDNLAMLDVIWNRKLHAVQTPGLPANGPITAAMLTLASTDAQGNPISPVGADVARLIDQRGGATIVFADALSAGGTAGVAPMRGVIWLPNRYADPQTQRDPESAALIAHESAHLLQRDLPEFPDGFPALRTGSWPFGPGGFEPFDLTHGAPLVGDFTLYMEVQSNIVQKTIQYDFLSARLAALPPADPARPAIQAQMDTLANHLATYTGNPTDAAAYVVQEYRGYGMYSGEMVREAIEGARIPPGGWQHWLTQQGFSDQSIQHITDVAAQGVPQPVNLSGMLRIPPAPGSQPPLVPTPEPVPTPPAAPAPTATPTSAAPATPPPGTPSPSTPGGTPPPTPTPSPAPGTTPHP